VINSNLGPISHCLATIHPLQMDNNAKDAVQHSCTSSIILYDISMDSRKAVIKRALTHHDSNIVSVAKR